MNIEQIKTLPNGTGGIEATGQVLRIFDPKSHDGAYGPWTSQNFVVKDETNEILVSLNNRQIAKTMVNKHVVLTNCKLRSYTDKDGNTQFILDMKKGSEIFEDSAVVETSPKSMKELAKEASGILEENYKTEEIKVEKITFTQLMLEATQEVMETFTDENFKKMWASMNVGDLKSEDARAFIISNIISKQRG